MRITIAAIGRLAAAALLFIGAPMAAAQDEYGTIKGQVIWAGESMPDLPPKVAEGENVKDGQVCAANPVPDESLAVDDDSKGVRYCLVYLVRPDGENPSRVKELLQAHPEAVIDQQGCRFIPHITAMHADQKALFKSSDPVPHNVHLEGFDNSLNVMLPVNGDLAKTLIAEKRPVSLSCDIHPWMQGYVMVLDHPFFAVTDEQGNFEIPGVPAGEQNLVIWQEKIGYVLPGLARGFGIEVQAGKTTTVGPVKLTPDLVKQ